jgi:hypothetical protein
MLPKQPSSDAVEIIEQYVARWLRESEMGRSILHELAVSFEEAMDAVFELLNTGCLKITGNTEGFTGIEFRIPPEPPTCQIRRPKRN